MGESSGVGVAGRGAGVGRKLVMERLVVKEAPDLGASHVQPGV